MSRAGDTSLGTPSGGHAKGDEVPTFDGPCFDENGNVKERESADDENFPPKTPHYPPTRYFSLLCVLTFSPLLLLLNDLLAPYYPSTGNPYYAYDDVFKCIIWAPLSLVVLARLEDVANPNPTPLQKVMFTVLAGMYVYGFGVNHSHNAVGNYYEKRLGQDAPAAVHFYDEYVGHYIIVLVYGLIQVYWSFACDRRTGGGAGCVSLGLLGGYLSALLVLESQSVPILLPIDVLLFWRPPADRELGMYVKANAGVHLLFYVCWRLRWGRYVEPTELATLGWSKGDIFMFGMQGSGPELDMLG